MLSQKKLSIAIDDNKNKFKSHIHSRWYEQGNENQKLASSFTQMSWFPKFRFDFRFPVRIINTYGWNKKPINPFNTMNLPGFQIQNKNAYTIKKKKMSADDQLSNQSFRQLIAKLHNETYVFSSLFLASYWLLLLGLRVLGLDCRELLEVLSLLMQLRNSKHMHRFHFLMKTYGKGDSTSILISWCPEESLSCLAFLRSDERGVSFLISS